MTLRDMLDAGIVFDGDVTVGDYDYEKEKYNILDIRTDEALDAEVKYIYADDDGELYVEVSRQL